MTLRRRLLRLEARAGGRGEAETAEAAGAFARAMLGLSVRLAAAGDTADRPGEAPAARYARAVLRGDGDTAGAILRDALGGQP